LVLPLRGSVPKTMRTQGSRLGLTSPPPLRGWICRLLACIAPTAAGL